jgi:Uma2 family endonuclease
VLADNQERTRIATQIKPTPITVEQYEDFEGFPGLRDELINGKIVLPPQPKPLHQQVSENIHGLLNKILSSHFAQSRIPALSFVGQTACQPLTSL